MATATKQRPGTVEQGSEILDALMDEISEYYEATLKAHKAVSRARIGSDAHEEALGNLSASAFALGLKAEAINVWLDHDASENLVNRLERLRAKLSAKKPVSVARFLDHIRTTMKLKAEEVPSEITYRRWLRQAKTGILKISPAHDAMLERFYAKVTTDNGRLQ